MLHLHVETETLLTGARLKGVTCDRCGQQYAYIHSRSVQSANEVKAYERLKHELTGCPDMVPCPKCGWVSIGMKEHNRRRLLRGLISWKSFIILMIVATVVFFCLERYECAIGIGCFIVFLVAKFFPRWYSLHIQKPLGAEQKPGSQPAWTREELEAAAEESPRLDISDAILDWESQKISKRS